MKRTNTFAVRPLSDDGEQLLRDLLDASAALWNEVNYQRLMRYNDEDGFEGDDVWDADTGSLEGKYKGVLDASTAQQVIRKNSEAWRGFFDTKNKYHDESNTSVTEHPEPPGFRGNENDGRVLKTVIRNTSYTVEWGERSRLEILVGSELKDRYDHTGRLRLEIAGDPTWPNYEKQGRLDLWYDETDSTFRASQPVTVSDDSSGSGVPERSLRRTRSLCGRGTVPARCSARSVRDPSGPCSCFSRNPGSEPSARESGGEETVRGAKWFRPNPFCEERTRTAPPPRGSSAGRAGVVSDPDGRSRRAKQPGCARNGAVFVRTIVNSMTQGSVYNPARHGGVRKYPVTRERQPPFIPHPLARLSLLP